MSLRLILWIIIFLWALALAFFLPGYDSAIALWSISIVSIFTLFQLLNSSVLTLMQANMKIEFSLFSAIFGKLVNLWLVAGIATLWFIEPPSNQNYTSFLWIIWASVAAIFVNTLLNYFYARTIEKFWFAFDWEYIKYIVKISLPYWIALFLSVVYFKVDIILLSLMDPLWDKSVALYSLPMKIVEVIMVLWGFYLNSVLPTLTTSFEEKNIEKFNKYIQLSFHALLSWWMLIFVLWVLFRDYLIEIIANSDYLDPSLVYNSSDAFLVVFAVVLFNFISLVFIYALIATKNQSKLLKINIVVTIVNIIWNIILIPYLSFIWAGIVTLLSQILLMILGYYYTNKIIDFKIPWKLIIKNIILCIVMLSWGYYILITYPVWLYFDVLVYWTAIFIIYWWIIALDIKKSLTDTKKRA
jgi:O-antigen/teichoic acid export membrane protein